VQRKGFYRFDETLFQELWDTPLLGEIPVQVLEQLIRWGAWCFSKTSLGRRW
jgi:hypothetical protein